MNETVKFNKEVENRIDANGENSLLASSSQDFLLKSIDADYPYNFSWLGRPIIQYPQDMIALQEIIWEVKPDLIIETGIAHGGSLIFSASMLALLESCGEIAKGHVLGIDIDIRSHNKEAIEKHPLSQKITMLEGSSIDENVIQKVKEFAKKGKKILVCLDSNHTHDHVLKELEAYSSLVSKGSYCIVFDTIIEDMPQNSFPNRPWDKGNNPKTAVWEFINKNKDFKIDQQIENKILITVAPDGFLKKIN